MGATSKLSRNDGLIYVQTRVPDRSPPPMISVVCASSYHRICLGSHSSSECWENDGFDFFDDGSKGYGEVPMT